MRVRDGRLSSAVSVCAILVLVAGCSPIAPSSSKNAPLSGISSNDQKPASSPDGSDPVASVPGSSFTQSQIQALNSNLNSSPNYALTSLDFQALQGSGLLSNDDLAALAVFVQQ